MRVCATLHARMPRAVQLEPSRDIVGLSHSARADSGSRRYIPKADPSIF